MQAIERARLWLANVPAAISGQNGHAATYAAACGLVHGFALSDSDAHNLLTDWNRGCQPPWSDSELNHKIRDAARQSHDKPRGYLLNARLEVDRTIDLKRVVFRKPQPGVTEHEVIRFLRATFDDSETVCICCDTDDETGRPTSSGSYLPAGEWIRRFQADPNHYALQPERNGVFVRINPYKPQTYSGSDADVTAYRHVLVEMDNVPKEEQESLLRSSGLPISALIDSGGKSIHGWVRVDAKDAKEWQQRRDAVFAAIPQADAKNKNPGRYSRLPGAHRGSTRQRLIDSFIGAESWSDWEANREDSDEKSTIISLASLFDYKLATDTSILIGNRWLCKGSSMVMSGGSGIGKSSLIMQFAIELALGRKTIVGAEPIRPLKVGLVQAENDFGDLSEAFLGTITGIRTTTDDCAMLKHNFRIRSDATRTGQRFLTYLRRFIVREKLDVVVVDPLMAFFGADLSDQETVSNFLRGGVQPILAETGVVIIFAHHIPKPPKESSQSATTSELAYSGFGSSELTNWAREIAVLQELGNNTPRKFRLTFTKRGGRLPAASMILQHGSEGILWNNLGPYSPMRMSGSDINRKRKKGYME